MHEMRSAKDANSILILLTVVIGKSNEVQGHFSPCYPRRAVVSGVITFPTPVRPDSGMKFSHYRVLGFYTPLSPFSFSLRYTLFTGFCPVALRTMLTSIIEQTLPSNISNPMRIIERAVRHFLTP